MNVWRFIYSGYSNPFNNMAMDMAMVDIYQRERVPIFRIYGWCPYSFSVGYSQKMNEVLDITACIKDGISFVRRPTGGGIIYHGNEVTYSVVLSSEDIGMPSTVKGCYKKICAFIFNAYCHYGLRPIFAIDSGQIKKEKSTLCFASFEDYDILINGKKIGGNAQKRHKGIIMQHGSIPLSLNYTPVLKYLKEKVYLSSQRTTDLITETGKEVSFDEFRDILKISFIETFGVQLKEGSLTSEEEKIVKAYEEQLIQEKNNVIRDS
ncbi:MAG: lipoate--protein ligase family protein [bacterium]|nr:lipoate--protein ligase family protein [bacterium]